MRSSWGRKPPHPHNFALCGASPRRGGVVVFPGGGGGPAPDPVPPPRPAAGPGGAGEGTPLTLCPPCARRLAMESQAARGGRSPFGPGPAGPGSVPLDENTSKTPALDEFGRDLTAEAAAGRIDPVIGRAAEVE